MAIVVFLGPSLPLDEARDILPDAIYRPPARQADVVSAMTIDAPDVIALIDGEFDQARSVWHKELLLAIERGIHVYGSSSMGALRAAELAPFGMVGRGNVFAKFASGELMDDDEVALSYHMSNGKYLSLSEPMVNIRATCDAALAEGVISDQTYRAAVDEAKAVHYPKRTLSTILKGLRRRGVEEAQVELFASYWRLSRVDVKANDARLLLQELRSTAQQALPSLPSASRMAVSEALNTLYDRERRINVGGVEIPLSDVAEHAMLHHTDVDAMNSAALNRALALVLAQLLHVEPSNREVDAEVARWRNRHRYLDDDDFARWLRRNYLSFDEFRRLAQETAACRALHRWLIYSHFEERSTRFVLDHLRWTGEFETWADRAAGEARLADEADNALFEQFIVDGEDALAEEHEEWTGKRFDTDLNSWAEEAGFNASADLTLSLAKAKLTRLRLLRLVRNCLDLGALSPSVPSDAPSMTSDGPLKG